MPGKMARSAPRPSFGLPASGAWSGHAVRRPALELPQICLITTETVPSE